MPRCWPALLGLGLIALSGAAPAQALSPREVTCPRLAASPTLDGRLDDWPPLPQLVMASPDEWHPAASQFADYGGPDDVSAEVRLGWNDAALYLALQVRDDVFERVRSASEIDRGDSIVLSAAADGETNQFVLARLSRGFLTWRAEPAAQAGNVRTINLGFWTPPEQDAGRVVNYELAIPWSELEPIRPIPGIEFRLTIAVCDDDGAGLKGCLEDSATVALSATGVAGAHPAVPAAPPQPASLSPVFAAPEAARFDRRSFVFDNRETVVLAGAIDYANLPREAWADRLGALKRAGLNAVAVTAAWSHHEPSRGAVSMDDLTDFLDLCKQAGLLVQLNIGPYAGERAEAGGVPAWALALGADARREAARKWLQAVLGAVEPRQVTVGGPVALLIARPLPAASGDTSPAAINDLAQICEAAGIEVPILTQNAPAARNNATQSAANVLDTISFYEPVDIATVIARVAALGAEENGPPAVSGLVGDYGTADAARGAASCVRAALAAGAAAVTIADFAPGLPADAFYRPGRPATAGVIEQSGAVTPGWGELRLLGAFLRLFGADLARAVAAPGAVQADAPDIRAIARLSPKTEFIFVSNESADAGAQVRLTFTNPGGSAAVSIPEAGAIALRPGEVKVLVLNAPVGRGMLRYSTSEIAALHRLGNRTLLAVYGDPDTPGEIALQWPGPPLVSGEVARQRWDAPTKTLFLDYYHAESDQYVLVDDLEIAILSRARARFADGVSGAGGVIMLSCGARLAEGRWDHSGLEATLECPVGTQHVTAAVPARPSSVTVDGKPVAFGFSTPDRVVTFDVTTEAFERERAPASVLDRVARGLLGGPPKLRAEFDRAYFMPDSQADAGTWERVGSPANALDVPAGSFVRLRASFDAAGRTRMAVAGGDAMLVFVNGRLIPELSGERSHAEADLGGVLTAGQNRLEVILQVLPRGEGTVGMGGEPPRLPRFTLSGAGAEVVVEGWEMCRGLGGEAAGWGDGIGRLQREHFVRFGPWRDRSGEWGVGWYQIPFSTPAPGQWTIPYRLELTAQGAGALYLNGRRLGNFAGDGEFVVPLPTPPLAQGEENLVAVALYGVSPQTGLGKLVIAAEDDQIARRRAVHIAF